MHWFYDNETVLINGREGRKGCGKKLHRASLYSHKGLKLLITTVLMKSDAYLAPMNAHEKASWSTPSCLPYE
jgi:hypothetical protein